MTPEKCGTSNAGLAGPMRDLCGTPAQPLRGFGCGDCGTAGLAGPPLEVRKVPHLPHGDPEQHAEKLSFLLTDKPGATPTVRTLGRICQEIVEGEVGADCHAMVDGLRRNDQGEWWLDVIAFREGE